MIVGTTLKRGRLNVCSTYEYTWGFMKLQQAERGRGEQYGVWLLWKTQTRHRESVIWFVC